MGSLFASTLNTRALPAGGLRYIRSDFPENLTETEIRWLLDHDVTTVVDLRSEEETVRKPCGLKDREGFRYHHFPVTGGGGTPKSREHLHEVYRQMLDGRMDEIIDTILNAGTGVLYFCTAGKDRTGVVSAVLLRRLEVPDEVIIDDYMASGDNLEEMLRAYADAHPEVDLEIILPHRENIERVLRLL